MFLDISFLGAAGYRKDGYARIYSALRKERQRKSVCLDEPIHFVDSNKYGRHHPKYEKSRAKLNVTLRYYMDSHELLNETRKSYHNKLNESFRKTNIQKHYEKQYARKHASLFNKVSIAVIVPKFSNILLEKLLSNIKRRTIPYLR